MQLTDLSFEALRLVTQYLPLLDLSNLWFTGFKPLHFKLANGGVSQLEVHFGSNLRPFQWPSMFSWHHGITSFILKDFGRTPEHLITVENLTSLSRNLRTLVLRVTGAFLALNQMLSRDPTAFSEINTLEIAKTTREELSSVREIRWPSNVTQLTFERSLDATHRMPLDTAQLPKSLTFLHGHFDSVLVDAVGSVFPKSLVSLNLSLSFWTNFLPLLPATLEHLAIEQRLENMELASIFPRNDFWASQIASLPRSLTSLSIPCDYTETMLKDLPQSITTLTNRKEPISPNHVSLLPPRLRIAGPLLLPSPITKSMAMEMPSSLERIPSPITAEALPHLRCKNVQISLTIIGNDSSLASELQELQLKRIPSSIERLSLRNIVGDALNMLPETLTSLQLSVTPLTTSQLQQLPPTLLQLVATPRNLLHDIGDLKLLPQSLTMLSLTIKQFLDAATSLLFPRNLKNLTVSECYGIAEDWFEGLPRCLELLRFTFAEHYAGPDWKRIKMPPHLTDLSFSIRHILQEGQTMGELFSVLPPSLLHLSIQQNHRTVVRMSYDDLRYMPNRLTYLRLPICRGLSSPEETWKALPKSLTSLRFGYSSFSYLPTNDTLPPLR